MSQQSEERLLQSALTASSAPPGARILPFERPQSDLQRAIQERAQEAIDRDRELKREVKRHQPVKWIVGLLGAMIPVLLILGAVDGFLRVIQRVTETYISTPAPTSDQQQRQQEQSPPASQPGVVMLQQYEPQRDAKPDEPKPAGEAIPR